MARIRVGRRAERPGKRTVTIDLDINLHDAIAQAALQDEHRPFGSMVAKICRQWFASQGQVIPIPPPVKRGRPVTKAASS